MNADERRCSKQVKPAVVFRNGEAVGELLHLGVLESLGWMALVLSVTGVVLNNFRLWPCFVFWMASNGLSAWIHRRTGPRSLVIRDLIFFGLAALGLWQWTR